MVLNPAADAGEADAGEADEAGELAWVLLAALAGPPLDALAVALVLLLGAETFGCQLSSVEPEKLT